MSEPTAALGGSVRWNAGLGQATGDIVSRLADLDLEPESIRQWLDEFAGIVRGLDERRRNLEQLALGAARRVQLGGLVFAEPLRAKLVDRVGPTEGGLAWALDGIVREMVLIHEAMRRSLASHLQADLEAESILHRVDVGAEAEEAGR